MVPAFKKPPKAAMNPNHAFFNTKLAGIRIKAEHCIGLIKARFECFKGVRIVIEDEASMWRIIRFFMCGCVLHNMLINEPVPSSWNADTETDDTQPRQANGLAEDDELNQPVDPTAPGGERQNELLYYLLETRYR